MGTFDAPTPTVTYHNDDENGGIISNWPKMGTYDAPTPTMTNSTQPYLSESGISSKNMTPRTLLSQIPSIESVTSEDLDKRSIMTGSNFYSGSTSSVITT